MPVLRAEECDVDLDFDSLAAVGTMLGSAGIMVMDDSTCMVSAIERIAHFYAHESCGQCTPCRVGSEKAAALMSEEHWDKDLLEELAQVMEDASICGLGQAAPNPIRCVIKYFPDELND